MNGVRNDGHSERSDCVRKCVCFSNVKSDWRAPCTAIQRMRYINNIFISGALLLNWNKVLPICLAVQFHLRSALAQTWMATHTVSAAAASNGALITKKNNFIVDCFGYFTFRSLFEFPLLIQRLFNVYSTIFLEHFSADSCSLRSGGSRSPLSAFRKRFTVQILLRHLL